MEDRVRVLERLRGRLADAQGTNEGVHRAPGAMYGPCHIIARGGVSLGLAAPPSGVDSEVDATGSALAALDLPSQIKGGN